MRVYCGPSVFVCVRATINKTTHTHIHTCEQTLPTDCEHSEHKNHMFSNSTKHTHTPPTSKPTHLTLSVSSPHPLCVFVCVVSRASYILCMQVKKKRKNKSKSKDKHVYRQRERERQTDRLTDWKSVQESSAQRIESERRRALWHFVIWFVCWQHVANAGLATRAWEIEHTNSCLCVLAYIHTHACGQLLLSGTLATDLRWPSMRVICLREFVVVAMPSLASFLQMTSQRTGNIAKRCTASLSASLSLSQLLFLFWFSSDMATAAWLSNDLVACFFFGATLRPCQCVENCICCGPQ